MLSVADTEGARLWAFDVEAPGLGRTVPPHEWPCDAGLPGTHADSLVCGVALVASLGSITEFSGRL